MKNNLVIALSLVFILSIFVLKGLNKKTSTENQLSYGCQTSDYSGVYDPLEETAYYYGEKISIPKYAFDYKENSNVLGLVNTNRWIEVDLSEQKLRAWDGDSLFLETPVSTGLPWWPTPTGEFNIWIKLKATKMEGGSGDYYYYLPNVPYVMFFENTEVPGWRGYSLHGTYWHNDFGSPHSHGCVNLPTNIAEKLFYWVGPDLGDRTWSVRATTGNSGTKVIIHE